MSPTSSVQLYEIKITGGLGKRDVFVGTFSNNPQVFAIQKKFQTRKGHLSPIFEYMVANRCHRN